MIADELRRQADIFTDLVELQAKIGRGVRIPYQADKLRIGEAIVRRPAGRIELHFHERRAGMLTDVIRRVRVRAVKDIRIGVWCAGHAYGGLDGDCRVCHERYVRGR